VDEVPTHDSALIRAFVWGSGIRPNAQLRKACACMSTADIRNNQQFKIGHAIEIHRIIFPFTRGIGRTEIILLTDDFAMRCLIV